jgi:PPK2 family polyphosphate:nucleotide phosphotransferase
MPPALAESSRTKKGKRLDDLEHKSIDEDDYKPQLKEAQLELLNLQRELTETRSSVVLVFEGPDAAGKGGAIKRLVEKLDPRLIRVHSVVKPTDEEYQHHYLWRFWNKLPPYGHITIFDRSWYGRVLVERVEGFATEKEWRRAYQEINEFERLLTDDGAIIVKFYLHISKDEQLYRFKRREADPYKHWKINDEDWRNRKKWDDHNTAAEEMFERTSTEVAPWHVIPANFKWFARVRIARLLADRLEATKFRKA